MHSVRRNGMEHIGSRLIHDISSRSHQPFEKFALLVPDEASPLAPEIKPRSEEHTSELQSLMRISYAVFCLKKKKPKKTKKHSATQPQSKQDTKSTNENTRDYNNTTQPSYTETQIHTC